MFIDILLPKTRPFTVGVLYRPPNDNNFSKNINDDFLKHWEILISTSFTTTDRF